MPRLIDRRIGQEALGVWDFAWSLVTYFGLVQAGVVSSVNRFVARYRAAGDVDGVNRAVSSVSCVLLVMSMIVVALTIATTLAVPDLLSSRLSGYVRDAKWVVFLLGVSLAIQIGASGLGGVITGCHRWDLHNLIEAGSYAVTVVGMIAVLLGGGGLPGLALMNLLGQLLGRGIRCVVAYRVFPGLRVGLRHVRWRAATEMLGFGGKSFVHTMTDLLLNQTTNILIVAYLGPAALAVYARPMALIRHVTTIVNKFAWVLGPTVSSLHAIGQVDKLRELLVEGTRYAACITLPLSLTLLIMGDPILGIWMGSSYEHGLLVGILAIGYFPSIVQEAVLAVLWGINAHGRAGLAKLAAALCALGTAIIVLGPLGHGLVGVAIAVTVPLMITNGVYVPICACRQLQMPVLRYVVETMQTPVLCAIPFAICLVGARLACVGNPFVTLATGAGIGGGILAVLYWKYVLPPPLKGRLERRLGLLGSRAPGQVP
jgi:O-antigen/teichoic acid export membrane protein